MCTGRCRGRTSRRGSGAARRMRRAAPLPNSVRVSAMSLVSDMVLSWVSRCLRRREALRRAEWLVRWGLGAGRGTTRADHVRPPDAARAPPRRSRTWGSSCSALQRPSPRQPAESRRPAVGEGNPCAPRTGQAWPSNRLVTEPSSKTSRIARLISGAIESTVSLSNCCSGGDRQRVGDHDLGGRAVLEPVDGRAGQDRVGRGDDHAGGAVVHQRLGGLHDRAAGVDHVVDQDADPALDLADHPVGDGLVGPVDVAGLVDERQRRAAEPGRPLLGDLDPAGVRARRRRAARRRTSPRRSRRGSAAPSGGRPGRRRSPGSGRRAGRRRSAGRRRRS